MFNQTEGTLLSCGGDSLSNYKLIIGSVIAILVVAIFTTLILVLGFARYMKDRIATVTNEAYRTGLHDMKHTERATYDYPNMENQAMKFINIKQNEAYATNAEAKPCVAYATNVTTERNDAYGIKFQDS